LKKVNSIDEVTDQDIGKYIRFEGLGILNGLKGEPVKTEIFKIVELREDGLVIRQYRRRKNSLLPVHNFKQGAEIYSKAEFDKMKVYY